MKKGIKTLAMWLIIGIIVIVLLSSIMENSSSKMTYSELVTSMENKEVESIKISSEGNVASVKLKNSKTEKEVKIPSLDSFMTYTEQYLKTGEKYYVSDLGLRYFMLGRKIGDRGHILENVIYLELLRRGYDVYIGKIDEYEVDFVALNSNGRIYVQVCDTLKDNENKILTRELNSLEKINDNYAKIILTLDKIPLSNENGIIVRNALEWLVDC